MGRCLLAADGLYARALAELRAGRKTGHWIWYVLPQLRGLGRSPMAQAYGIAGRAKAEACPPIRCGWMAARARGSCSRTKTAQRPASWATSMR
ncbi:DUF1810 family protein [Roseateles sp.]|uniref:DUF1810 family protein n=1 Tax=Roseateles sp. TaxID=1971397 RepID=UPI0039E93B55